MLSKLQKFSPSVTTSFRPCNLLFDSPELLSEPYSLGVACQITIYIGPLPGDISRPSRGKFLRLVEEMAKHLFMRSGPRVLLKSFHRHIREVIRFYLQSVVVTDLFC